MQLSIQMTNPILNKKFIRFCSQYFHDIKRIKFSNGFASEYHNIHKQNNQMLIFLPNN